MTTPDADFLPGTPDFEFAYRHAYDYAWGYARNRAISADDAERYAAHFVELGCCLSDLPDHTRAFHAWREENVR